MEVLISHEDIVRACKKMGEDITKKTYITNPAIASTTPLRPTNQAKNATMLEAADWP